VGNIIIRPALPGDLRPVQRLLRDALSESYRETLDAARLAALNATWHSMAALCSEMLDWHTSFLVAEDAGAIVGHGLGRMRAFRILHVARLFVDPGYHRKGVGRALLADMEARHPGALRTSLDVDEANTGARVFYARLGFIQVSARDESWRTLLTLEKQVGRKIQTIAL
jgi:ribosomal protein S18 acetylase RimI-like enzyme